MEGLGVCLAAPTLVLRTAWPSDVKPAVERNFPQRTVLVLEVARLPTPDGQGPTLPLPLHFLHPCHLLLHGHPVILRPKQNGHGVERDVLVLLSKTCLLPKPPHAAHDLWPVPLHQGQSDRRPVPRHVGHVCVALLTLDVSFRPKSRPNIPILGSSMRLRRSSD
jgi:hypothetical protein